MAKHEIAIRGFTYYDEVVDPGDPNRKVTIAKMAVRGETVDLSAADVERGKAIGAFAGSAPEKAPEVAFDLASSTDEELDAHLNTTSPNVGATVALAGGDPEAAKRVLAAEERTRPGDPRGGVVKGLTKVIEG